MDITLDVDIRHIAKFVLENNLLNGVIYFASDSARHPLSPTYRLLQTVTRMAEIGLIKVKNTGSSSQIKGLKIQQIPYYEVDFYPSAIKDYLSGKVVAKTVKEKVLWAGKLQLNLQQGTIQYGDNKPVEVSTEREEIIFLKQLLENERIVSYEELAWKLGFLQKGQEMNKIIASYVQRVRRDLFNYLNENNIPCKELKSLMKTKTNKGYKIQRA
jgi:hypothetical protein